MAVEQTRNVIEQVRRFHQWASQYYHRLADSTQRDRVKLLLEYMSGHERRLADCLKEYEAGAPPRILNTWLIEPEAADAMKWLQDDVSHADMTVDEIIDLGIRLSTCAVGVYESVAESSEPESVRDAFANLLSLEQKSLQQFARDSGRLGDL